MNQTDYVFRYRLDPEKCRTRAPRHRVMQMITDQLKNVLDLIIPCSGDTEVSIDGFKTLNNPDTIHRLYEKTEPYPAGKDEVKSAVDIVNGDDKPEKRSECSYQSIQNALLYEPRIGMIKRQLESLLSLVELESDGKAIKPDGFRLQNLGDWVVPVSDDPSEIFEHAGTRCNCDCVFCYNKGIPDSLALRSPERTPKEEFDEIRTRIRYYNPVANRGLFPSIGSPHEVLAHPYINEVLTELRGKTDKKFRIVTNGASLSPKRVGELAKLKPVYIDIDLNSSDPLRRRDLMRDKRSDVAITALSLLKEKEIPYSVIIVPWPVPAVAEMLEDLEKTVKFSLEHDVHLVQVSMPGYSRYLSQEKLFDHESAWRKIALKVGELRETYDCPIVIMPGMFEENLFREKKNVAEVIGLVKHSPAAEAGIRQGDIIRRIGGIRIKSRPQARGILSILQRNRTGEHTLVIERRGRSIECFIDLSRFSYPYSPATDTHLGVVFMGTGLRSRYIGELRKLIASRQAKRVLFLSSDLMKPGFQQELEGRHGFSDIELRVVVPENRFFGGNIFMGDLLVVEDFIRCIEKYGAEEGGNPDLVVIPSSPFNLSQWGRDLTGRCYLDIERETGIPVALLPCDTIFD